MALTSILSALGAAPTPNYSGNLSLATYYDDPADSYASVTRAQYADYQKRYVPVENTLMNMTSWMSPDIVNKEIDAAVNKGGYINNAMDVAESNQDYALHKYGMNQTAEAAQAQNVASGVNRSTAVVDAANRIRQRVSDRNQAIALGSASLAAKSRPTNTK